MLCDWEGNLASHWPCGTDFRGLSTYGLNGYEREMTDEHPTYAPEAGGAWSTLPLPFSSSLSWAVRILMGRERYSHRVLLAVTGPLN